MAKWIYTLMTSLIIITSTGSANSLSESCSEIEDQLLFILKQNRSVAQCEPFIDRSETYITIVCLNIDFHEQAYSTMTKAIDQLDQFKVEACKVPQLIIETKVKMKQLAERLKS